MLANKTNTTSILSRKSNRRSTQPSPKGGKAGLAMMAGGLVVFFYCAVHLLNALRTGTVAGKLGEVYTSSQGPFMTNMVLTVVGMVLALACVGLGWKWWTEPPEH